MTGLYLLAGIRTEITSVYPDVHRLCADYRTQGTPELYIRTTRTEISAERQRTEASQHAGDGYLETLAVYRRLAEEMIAFRTILIHSSAIGTNGAAYLFAAKSGTGKSTHTRLWREMLGDAAVMLNDDKPLVTVNSGGAIVHGTPWDGKHRLSAPISLPLGGICFLEQGRGNRITPLTAREAFPMLAAQTYRPADPAGTAGTLLLLEQLAGSVPLYRMQCNVTPEAAAISYGTMTKGQRI